MRGIDPSRVERVSRRLGEAALDPSLWPEIMEEICRATGTTGAVLLQSDVRTPDVPRTAGAHDMISNYFANNWHTRDLRVRGVPLILSGEPVITDQDFVTPEEMRTHPYYNDILLPFNLLWFAGIGFWSESALWVLCLQRSPREGPFEAEDKQLLAELAPRLTEVATLSTAVGRSVISGVTDALASIGRAALLLDRFGFVLDSNAAADRIFDDDLRIHGRRLIVRDLRGKAELEELIDRLRTTPDRSGFPMTTFVVRRQRRSAVLIRAMPVPPAARAPFLGARALLTLSTLEPAPAPEPAILAKAFGLTQAEARLASLIAAGTSPSEAARRLGISRETARNQLKAIFGKTDTHRQSELAVLLSKLTA
jgi:DNA-binding CsgD family transcriptional regulator